MPETATAPASAAPAPSTAAPAAAAPAPQSFSPATTAIRKESFANLERFAEGGEKSPVGNRPGEKKPDAPAAAKPTVKEDDAPADEPVTPPAKPDAAKPADQPTAAKPEKAKTLREGYDHFKSENAKLSARVKELETAQSQPKDDPEKKTLSDKLTEREKRLQELEEEVRFTSYERSQEYKDKWEKPFIDAYQAGRNKIASFRMTAADGTPRQGTPEEFDRFMQIADDNDAADAAVEMFGNRSSIAMYHREQVQQRNHERNAALDDFKKNGAEREKTRTETFRKQHEDIYKHANETWKKLVTEPLEKFPHIFKPVDGDTEGNDLLTKGFQFASDAFKNMNALDPKLTTEQRTEILEKQAVVFNKAAAFDRTHLLYKRATKQLKALEKELAEFKSSQPGGGEGATKPGGVVTADDLQSRMMKYAR